MLRIKDGTARHALEQLNAMKQDICDTLETQDIIKQLEFCEHLDHHREWIDEVISILENNKGYPEYRSFEIIQNEYVDACIQILSLRIELLEEKRQTPDEEKTAVENTDTKTLMRYQEAIQNELDFRAGEEQLKQALKSDPNRREFRHLHHLLFDGKWNFFKTTEEYLYYKMGVRNKESLQDGIYDSAEDSAWRLKKTETGTRLVKDVSLLRLFRELFIAATGIQPGRKVKETIAKPTD